MTTYYLTLADEFQCLGSDCPVTCCRGWNIPIDDAAAERIQKEPGKLGRSLRMFLKGSDPVMIRRRFGHCPMLTKEGLCALQRDDRMDLMGEICRIYPREPVAYSDRTEVTLELSCIRAAELLIGHPGRLFFREGKPLAPWWEISNDDPRFLSFLLNDREVILEDLWGSGRELPLEWRILYDYVEKEHARIVRDRLGEAEAVSIRACEEEVLKHEKEVHTGYGYAFFPMTVIDRMIVSHINYGALFFRSPEFYSLLRRYDRMFSKVPVADCDELFDRKVRKMLSACPSYEEKYRSYFSFNIQQLYLKAYESCFILRQFLFSVLYTQLLMLLDLIDFERIKEAAPIRRQAEVLSMLERGVRHNQALTGNLMQVLREDFL